MWMPSVTRVWCLDGEQIGGNYKVYIAWISYRLPVSHKASAVNFYHYPDD